MRVMKKKILTIVLAGMTACSVLALGGCADSAYDIAVKNGFTGTEQEWLQSLKGADGEDAPAITVRDVYDAAVADGTFSGTFNEFLQQYLTVGAPDNNDVETLANNLLSTVSIYTGFKKKAEDALVPEIDCAAGSGVIIDLDQKNGNALVITNYHVVYDSESLAANGISDSIYLYLYGSMNSFDVDTGKDVGGDGIKARFLGGSMDYDIALLAIEGSDVLKNSPATEAKFGDSNTAVVGEKVFVIGNSQGLGIAVSQGVLSVDSEYISMKALDGGNRSVSYRVMRTDAAINGGNSGGPMFNSQGELIAIVNAKSIANDVENMGFALPAAQVQGVVQNLINHDGSVKRAMLGVMVNVVDSSAVLNTDGTVAIKQTLRITSIETNSAAEGKLAVGDILQSITHNGNTYLLTRLFHTGDILLHVKAGDTVLMQVIRNGVKTTVEIPFDKAYYFLAVA